MESTAKQTNKQNVIPNAYFIQKYFHKLALLLILRELIGIYTVKTLLHKALLIMAMWGGETLCVSDTNHMVHIKKNLLNIFLSIHVSIPVPKEKR